jgi:hypothetical protein
MQTDHRLDAWLRAAIADAERRDLPELKPLLETLAASTARLRKADRAEDGSSQRRDESGS